MGRLNFWVSLGGMEREGRKARRWMWMRGVGAVLQLSRRPSDAKDDGRLRLVSIFENVEEGCVCVFVAWVSVDWVHCWIAC
jgi:hypothetical protein